MIVLALLFSLWDKILRLLGTSEQQVRWKQHLREREREARKADRKNATQHVTYRHKNCDACGRIVDRDVRVCPYCDAPVGSWKAKVGGRLVDTFLPGSGAMTSLLLIANGGFFIAIVATSGDVMRGGGPFVQAGAKWGPSIFVGEWWRFITYMFLHGGLVHIAFNLYALAVIGPIVEEFYGGARSTIIYFASGIAGGVVSHLWSPFIPSVGASGALMGLMGAGIVVGHLSYTAQGRAMRDQLLRWFFFTAFFGLVVGGIDNAAHFGGFAVGAGLGAGLHFKRALSERETLVFRLIATGLVFATLYALGRMVIRVVA